MTDKIKQQKIDVNKTPLLQEWIKTMKLDLSDDEFKRLRSALRGRFEHVPTARWYVTNDADKYLREKFGKTLLHAKAS